MTYSELKNLIQNYLENTETTFVSDLPQIIKQAEERILKGVELDQFRKNVTGTGTSSNTYLSMPTDFLAPFSLAVVDTDNNYNFLKLKKKSHLPVFFLFVDLLKSFVIFLDLNQLQKLTIQN